MRACIVFLFSFLCGAVHAQKNITAIADLPIGKGVEFHTCCNAAIDIIYLKDQYGQDSMGLISVPCQTLCDSATFYTIKAAWLSMRQKILQGCYEDQIGERFITVDKKGLFSYEHYQKIFSHASLCLNPPAITSWTGFSKKNKALLLGSLIIDLTYALANEYTNTETLFSTIHRLAKDLGYSLPQSISTVKEEMIWKAFWEKINSEQDEQLASFVYLGTYVTSYSYYSQLCPFDEGERNFVYDDWAEGKLFLDYWAMKQDKEQEFPENSIQHDLLLIKRLYDGK